MKTKLKILSVLMLLIASAFTDSAYGFKVDGIYYNKTSGAEVEVTSGDSKYSGSVTIPASVTYGGTTYAVTEIGDYAFYSCRGLTSVTIPNSVTSIGYYAFYNCSGLTAVHISDLAAWCKIEFGNYAANPLDYAHNLYLNGEKVTNLVIPNSVTSIGYSAFRGCSGLTSVTIPNSVTSIGDEAFSYCSGLTAVHITDLAAWCKIDFGSSDANPLYYAHNLYLNGEKVTNLVIPKSTQSIKNYTFYGCSSFTSIAMPNSVTSIGDEAFSYCSGLTSVTIGNSVTSIGDYAFDNCSGLTSVTIPNSVTSIGYYAFCGCSGLTSVTIPNSVTYIGYYAFSHCSGLTSVTIPNSVTSISEGAFSHCSGLTSVTIPNSVTKIGNRAFYYCSGLTSVTIPNSVTEIGAYAFSECSGLTSVTIPNSVTKIGNRAFYYCSGLTSVTIPNSVTSIGEGAFAYCSGLTAVHISDLAAWCKIEFGNSDANPLCYAHNLYLNGEKVTNLVIPNSVTKIGNRAFYGCSGLTSVTIGNSVESIGKSVFNECTALSKVSFADGNSTLSIGQAFANCPLSEVYIGRNLNYDSSPFRGKTTLKTVTIGNSVTTIGNYAFAGCSGLASLTIGKSLTSIGNSAFEGCNKLTSVTMPNTMTTIGEKAFYGCSGLESLTIGRNTSEIGDYTFSGCENICTIYSYAGTPPTIYEHTFENVTHAKANLYVPKGCVSIYEADPLWYPFYNILEGDYNGADDVIADEASGEVVGYYNLQGVRSDEPWKGLNIVVYSDGTRRKIRY